MTPSKARKKEHLDEVRLNLAKFRNNTRIYHEIKKGDRVRIYKKKKKAFDKERPQWSTNTYEVLGIVDNGTQKSYKVASRANLIVRAELFVIPS